jgi:hypothetical protein
LRLSIKYRALELRRECLDIIKKWATRNSKITVGF